jgi:hypothetical protein
VTSRTPTSIERERDDDDDAIDAADAYATSSARKRSRRVDGVSPLDVRCTPE